MPAFAPPAPDEVQDSFTPPAPDEVQAFTPPPPDSVVARSSDAVGQLGMTSGQISNFAPKGDIGKTLKTVNSAVEKLEGWAGDVLRAGANEVIHVGQAWSDVLHPVALLTGQPTPQIKPYVKGDSFTPKFVSKTVGALTESVVREATGYNPGEPEPMATGLGKAAEKAAIGLGQPETLSTLPLLEFKLGRAGLGLIMALQAPDQIKETAKVFQNPDAAREQKWTALGDAGINLAMLAGIAKSLKPADVMGQFNPEQAAEFIRQDKNANGTPSGRDLTMPEGAGAPVLGPEFSEAVKTIESSAPMTAKAVDETLKVPLEGDATLNKTVEAEANKGLSEANAAKSQSERLQELMNKPDLTPDETAEMDKLKSVGNTPGASWGGFTPPPVDAPVVPKVEPVRQPQSYNRAAYLRASKIAGDVKATQEQRNSSIAIMAQLEKTFPTIKADVERQQSEKVSSGKMTVIDRFNKETEIGGEDILSWMNDNGKLLSKSQARKKGDDWWSQNSSLYDGSPKLSAPHHSVVYDPSGSTPDVVAQAAFESGKISDPTPDALWTAMDDASKARAGIGGQAGKEAKILAQDESDQIAKDNAVAEASDKAERDAIDNPNGSESGFVPPDVADEEVPVEHIGMGGAVPKEFEPGQGTPTSNKNATVDKERSQRGLPPMMTALKKTWGEAWDKAMAMIDQDFGYQDKLIKELENKPRALEDFENAALLHRRVDLRNEYDKSTREGAQAYQDGRMDDVAEANLRTAQWSDRLSELEAVTKASGTESGRSLAARKMMANEDFTLAKMELDKRAANEFRPLTKDERAELVALHDKLAASEKALADYQAGAQERISKAEADKTIAEMQRDEAKQPRIHPAILKKAEEFVAGFERRANDARTRLKQRLGQVSAGVDPMILKDVAEIGLGYLARGTLEFGKWSAKLVEEFGDVVKPYLADAFTESQRLLREGLDKAPTAVRRAVKDSQSIGEQIMGTGESIEKKVTAGKKNEISGQVQKLARLFVKQGVKDRDDLISKVHDVLKRILPEITRRETMDAISGYGDFKQLTQDQINVQLRGMKGEMQQIAKLEDMAKGEPPAKSGVERRTPTEAERQLVKLVNKAKFEFQVPITDPATQLKSALDTYKTTLRNRITDLQAALDAGDYSKVERRQLQLDPEAMRLKAESERLKQQFRLGLAKDRLKARNWWQKTMDTLVKWRRGFILSGPVTLAKLTTAALARGIITPIEEGVGAGISKIVPSVASKARREGGASLTAETKAITEGFTRGMQDAWKTLRTGQSDLDLVFGKGEKLPQSFIDIFGNVHGALKAPVKRAEFARSFQKRAEAYAREGVDVTDEFVQTKIGMEAYQDAMKAIFMQRNIINDAYKRLLTRFDQFDKETGKPSLSGATLGTTARVLMPIVKVPTNIVGETMQYAIGSVTGSARLGSAFAKGIEKLKPEEADLIMRHLKKGSLGAAAVLTGYLAPQVFGGFYQQGQKRKKDDIKPDAMRIDGQDIEPYLIHNPFVTAAQLGATVRRVSDSKLRKKDSQTQGLSHGAMAAALGLADATPFIREMTEIEKLMNPYERDQWLAEMTRSMLVPQALQSVANQLDKDEYGDTVKRKAVTPLEGVEKGIPGLRQTLPKQK